MSDPESLYRLGSSLLEAASALPLRGGLGHPRRLARFVIAVAHRPRRGLALVRLVVRTRSEHVCLSNSRAGHALRRYFDRRFLVVFPQNRLCRGVLLLPGNHREYLRGRRARRCEPTSAAPRAPAYAVSRLVIRPERSMRHTDRARQAGSDHGGGHRVLDGHLAGDLREARDNADGRGRCRGSTPRAHGGGDR